ncbi:hypothetical protein DPMN_109707 [Dreissena polymorpha]|uniref:Alpha-macroglobulin-like TED domain-containing protein n=1 Tax=Dreissena polymorpha TaxID=45954 RepID=A0A9D4KBI3_DREPO|nr:hypothetical protein DPMN_109707 [Dreissena polymorpha]
MLLIAGNSQESDLNNERCSEHIVFIYTGSGIEKVASYGCINTDGSFNSMHFPQPGLWVTAFVVRVMCQAEQVVPGSFGRSRIQQMLGYLLKQTRDGTGNFIDWN